MWMSSASLDSIGVASLASGDGFTWGTLVSSDGASCGDSPAGAGGVSLGGWSAASVAGGLLLVAASVDGV